MTGRSASRLLTLRTVKRRVRALAGRLGDEPACLPTFGRSRQDGRPHIEVGDTYCFVVCERGQLFERHCSTDLDQLLYWVFAEVTFSMAFDHELRHRRPGEDSRRQLFAKQVELLARLSPAWAEQGAEEHRRILEEYPFKDQ